MKKYIMTSNTYFADKNYVFYGIALVVEAKGQLEVMEEYNCLTDDELQIRNFVRLCNEFELQQSDFQNVVEDFIVSAERR